MNHNPRIHGILVQLPLPRHLDESAVLLAIHPDKDADGLHPVNLGRMVMGEKAILSCTPHGVLQLLVRSGVTIDGRMPSSSAAAISWESRSPIC